jgi:hypothetical protein
VPEEIGQGEGLFPFERVHLERLLLAADVILELAGEGPVSDVLEVELRAFRERVQLALLRLRVLPERPQVSGEATRGAERVGVVRAQHPTAPRFPRSHAHDHGSVPGL